MTFPSGFLWGASTSAYQVEGAAHEAGKGPSVIDIRQDIPEGTADFSQCADHYHHWQEDVELFAEMGLKCYRFSIAWTRIIPEGVGAENQAGIDFYHGLIDALRKKGIEPIITIYHFDLPAALEAKGGWGNRETITAFAKYVEVLTREYGTKVRYWLTINEQNMMVLHSAAMLGANKLQELGGMKTMYQHSHHMLVAQAKAFDIIHRNCPNALAAPAPNITAIYPATSKPEDQIAAGNWSAIRNWNYLDVAVRGKYNSIVWKYLSDRDWLPKVEPEDWEILANGRPDFIAFNYYATRTVAAWQEGENLGLDQAADQQIAASEAGVYTSVSNPNLVKTEFGWEIDPVGFRVTLREIWGRYDLPLMITENGLGAYDTVTDAGEIHDPYRIAYLRAHIEEMEKAVAEGIEVLGYCPWSAIDLISTHQGMRKRYGFIYVNRDDDGNGDFSRLRKDSFYWYQKLIASNGINR